MAGIRTPRADPVRDSVRSAPAGRRPDTRHRAPDDPRVADRAEVARVLGVRPVVAHREERARLHAHRPEVDAVDRLVIDERLADLAAVDDEDAVLEADRVAADGDDPLEQDLAAARRVERDELAALGVVARALDDERLVAGLERRLHALRRDAERLGDEDADEHEHRDQTDADGDPGGTPPARGGFRLFGDTRSGRCARRRGAHTIWFVNRRAHSATPRTSSAFSAQRRFVGATIASRMPTSSTSAPVQIMSTVPIFSSTPLCGPIGIA